jgi:hypothetical protein
MPTSEIVCLAALGGLVWLWLDSLRARDAGIEAVREACAVEGLQLLDETVAIMGLKPTRNEDGRLVLRRVYEFEFSDTGDNRRRGSVVVLGDRVAIINLGLRLVASGTSHTLH